MKALMKTEEKVGAEIIEIPDPILEDNEVLIKPEYAAICGTDTHIYNWDASGEGFAKSFNVQFPFVFGHEVSGKVVSIGQKVKRLNVGDTVSLETHIPCMKCYSCQNGDPHNCLDMSIYGVDYPGAFSEYAKAPEAIVFKVPDTISMKEACLLEPAGVAMHAVDVAEINPGDIVLTCGAGPIGLMAVQIAFLCGASKVIALDINEYRLGQAKELGAVTINPMKDNIKEIIQEECKDAHGVDIAIELTGSPKIYEYIHELIRVEGKLVSVGHVGDKVGLDITKSVTLKGIKWRGIFGRKIWRNWLQVKRFMESGRLDLSKVITHEFPISKYKEAFELKEPAGKIIFKDFDFS